MSGDDDIFIASSLIADTPEKEKENATPSETPVAIQRSGDNGPRSGRKSLLGRRRSSIGRRLSGFGGGGFDANTDQGKLKSMYSSIIKLNSENKITRDKCWGLHLIDYMDKVIMDEGGQAGGSKVNFQKASCTLDASVKIYSHRVDATHMSSYSLLENLSRTDGDKAVKGSGASVGSSERSTKLGVHETLKKASQLNQSEMDRAFEVDPMFHKMSKIFDEAGSKGMLLNNLNVGEGCKVSFESEIKTASDSPEGNNTEKLSSESEANEIDSGSGSTGADEERHKDDTLNYDRCGGISAASQDDAETSAKRPGGMVDVSGLRAKLSELCDDLTTLSLCPQLQEFRDLISVLDGSVILPSRETVMATATATSDVDGGDVGSESDGDNGGGFDDLPDGDNASFDGGTGGEDNGTEQMEADPFVADTGECLGVPPVSFGAEGVSPFAAGDLSMIGFEGGLDGETVRSSEGAVVRPTSIEGRLLDDLKIVNDDYSFYEFGALAAAAAACANNWAGASHWKFVGVKKKLTRPKRERNTLIGDDDTEAIVEDDDGEGNNGRKTRGKRKPPAIDFDSTAVPLAALSAPKAVASRSRRGKKPVDKTLLSQDYISRAKKDAEEGTSRYVLPENAGFKPRDLAELFLRPGAITKRWAASEAGTGVGQPQRYSRGFVDGSPTAGGFFVEGNDDLLFADENDDYGGEIGGGGGDDDDDGDNNNGTQSFHFDGGFIDGEENAMKNEGVIGEDGVFVDDFEAEGLLSAERRVEKIDVAYARKAKKVDVRRLKGDLWRKIDSFVSTKKEKAEPKTESDVDVPTHPEGDDSEDESQSKLPEVVDMTFSDIVLDVSSTEEQSGVTVPFYFICVLHLANEKGLKLEGRDDLLDFSVSSDSVG